MRLIWSLGNTEVPYVKSECLTLIDACAKITGNDEPGVGSKRDERGTVPVEEAKRLGKTVLRLRTFKANYCLKWFTKLVI